MSERKRVLVDRHQADLFRAMQRLFEDRLGFEVWTPMGMEWWTEGYWRFGECFNDEAQGKTPRLAAQYIVPDSRHERLGHTAKGQWVTYDTAHPETPIRCISVDRAREIGGWSFVVATVQENQRGLKKFADEQGAQFVVQVGNTGQRIEWDLDPAVISSSEMPILGRGVIAHQEFHSAPGGAFGFADPVMADRQTVRNFVNLLHRIPGAWDDFQEMERLLPDWHFYVHGHEGREGVIQPSAMIGSLMATSGWGWHVKPVGDGFGHVIHGWAAVGRPLIGRSSFYRGKLAEPLWEHGVTCVDLDQLPDMMSAANMVEEISSNFARYSAMCCEIRARFDKAVDYGRDEIRVRELLNLPAR